VFFRAVRVRGPGIYPARRRQAKQTGTPCKPPNAMSQRLPPATPSRPSGCRTRGICRHWNEPPLPASKAVRPPRANRTAAEPPARPLAHRTADNGISSRQAFSSAASRHGILDNAWKLSAWIKRFVVGCVLARTNHSSRFRPYHGACKHAPYVTMVSGQIGVHESAPVQQSRVFGLCPSRRGLPARPR